MPEEEVLNPPAMLMLIPRPRLKPMPIPTCSDWMDAVRLPGLAAVTAALKSARMTPMRSPSFSRSLDRKRASEEGQQGQGQGRASSGGAGHLSAVERDDDEVRSAEGAIISAEVRAIFPSTEVMLWAAAFTRSSPSEACFRAEPESPTDTHTQVRSEQSRSGPLPINIWQRTVASNSDGSAYTLPYARPYARPYATLP